MNHVIGIDVNFDYVIAGLYSQQGTLICHTKASFDVEQDSENKAEVHPTIWQELLLKVLHALKEQEPAAFKHVQALSIAGQTNSLVIVDQQMAPLRNAILWMDTRSTKQSTHILNEFGHKIRGITKNYPINGFALAKLLWLRENEPYHFNRIRYFLSPKDYLNYYLTGHVATDHAMASGSMMYDVEQQMWSKTIQEEFNLPDFYPSITQTHTIIGSIRTELAEKIGFCHDVDVICGSPDYTNFTLGAGVAADPSKAVMQISDLGIFISSEEHLRTVDWRTQFFNQILPGLYCSMGFSISAGSSLKWFHENFYPDEELPQLLQQLSTISPGTNGLLFAPYINGEASPLMDYAVRGSFIGIDMRHTRQHFLHAVIEGITYSFNQIKQSIEEQSEKSIREIVSTGEFSSDNYWLQLQANIFNCQVVTLKNSPMAVAAGAAISAAVGEQWFTSFEECMSSFVAYEKHFYPQAKTAADYQQFFQRYIAIYEEIRSI